MRIEGRNRLLVVAVVVALVGVLGLYAYATTLQGRQVRLGDVGGDDVGSLVRVEGLLKDSRTTSGGSLRWVVMDPEDYATLGVFLPREVVDGLADSAAYVPGASVALVGEVQEYRGAVELYVASPRDVRLLAPAPAGPVEVDVLARNPEAWRGMQITAEGLFLEPEVIVDGKRYAVEDATGTLWAYVTVDGAEGAAMDVFGVLQFNEVRTRWEVKVAGAQDGIFPSPAIIPAGYAEATVAELLADPAAYEDSGVAILGANVTRGERIGTRFVLLDEGEDDDYSVEGFVFGWDFEDDPRGLQAGAFVAFTGTFDYYEEGARWQIQTDAFTLTP